MTQAFAGRVEMTPKNAYTRGKEHVSTVNAGQAPPHAQSQVQLTQSQRTQNQPFQAPSQTLGIRKPPPKPTLKHHVDEKHAAEAEPPKFKMEVTEVFGGDALMSKLVRPYRSGRQEDR